MDTLENNRRIPKLGLWLLLFSSSSLFKLSHPLSIIDTIWMPSQRCSRCHRIFHFDSVTPVSTFWIGQLDAKTVVADSTILWLARSVVGLKCHRPVSRYHRDPVNDPSENTLPFTIYGLLGLTGESSRGSVSLLWIRSHSRIAATHRWHVKGYGEKSSGVGEGDRTFSRKIAISVVYAIPRR